jgi:hypothetical protein
LIWATIATVWALVATVMHRWNPLPFPDRGHRVFALSSEAARMAVIRALRTTGNLRDRFTFQAGPTLQTLMWDGFTVLNHLSPDDPEIAQLPGNGLSLPVKDPAAAAELAVEQLCDAGFPSVKHEITDPSLPPNHLIVVESKAFSGWVLVFRRSLLRMPKPKFVSPN